MTSIGAVLVRCYAVLAVGARTLRIIDSMLVCGLDWAAAERHLHDGEARLLQLEAVVAEMARHDRAEAGLLVASALVPLRRGVAEMRERLAAARAEQAAPPPFRPPPERFATTGMRG